MSPAYKVVEARRAYYEYVRRRLANDLSGYATKSYWQRFTLVTAPRLRRTLHSQCGPKSNLNTRAYRKLQTSCREEGHHTMKIRL